MSSYGNMVEGLTHNFRPTREGWISIGSTTAGVYSAHWREPEIDGKPGSQVLVVSADSGIKSYQEVSTLASSIVYRYQG